jgi:hypothetical protein
VATMLTPIMGTIAASNVVIRMNTRWHEEDAAGKVLEQIESKEIGGRPPCTLP